jgi:hypothetical protein
MGRLSSASTGICKRLFPVFRCGFLLLSFALAGAGRIRPHGADWQRPDVAFLLMPVAMVAFGFLMLHITLMSPGGSRFSRNISFIRASPRRFLCMFKPDPIATELIGRVDALRGVPR